MDAGTEDQGVERVLAGLERLLQICRDAFDLASAGRLDHAPIASLALATMEACPETVRGTEEVGCAEGLCARCLSEAGRQLGDEPKPGHDDCLLAREMAGTRLDRLECFVVGISKSAEPPCTDPYARWCDRESP